MRFRFFVVSTAVWASLAIGQSYLSAQVLAGIDVLIQDDFESLRGQRVALITNQTGIDARGVPTAQRLHASANVDLVALFSPEHGIRGALDQPMIQDEQDRQTGLQVYSLYGENRVPTSEMLTDVDTLVFDIQDIGTRFYTYISTMGGAMKAAATHRKRFVVLDRPNPINGVSVQGPVLDSGSESFVGYHTIAVRHGMTIGELARMFASEMELQLDLDVVEMRGWDRREMFDATGRLWVNPSPNMRSLTQAVLYPGIGLIETTNVSVGRGTDTPFEVIGAPWIDGVILAGHLNRLSLRGVRFVPIQFQPNSSKYADQVCGGVNIIVTHRDVFHPLRTGLSIAVTLHRVYADQWETKSLNRLLASEETLNGILSGRRVDQIQSSYRTQLQTFERRRNQFLLYR